MDIFFLQHIFFFSIFKNVKNKFLIIYSGVPVLQLVQYCLSKMKGLATLTLVVKQFLRERGLNDTFRGGASSYTIFLMLVKHLQPHYPPLFEGDEFNTIADNEIWASMIRDGRKKKMASTNVNEIQKSTAERIHTESMETMETMESMESMESTESESTENGTSSTGDDDNDHVENEIFTKNKNESSTSFKSKKKQQKEKKYNYIEFYFCTVATQCSGVYGCYELASFNLETNETIGKNTQAIRYRYQHRCDVNGIFILLR